MLNKEGLTIFTPTYNRENLLNKLYNNLLEQSDKDFEWLIVDDGSSDKTKDLIKSFIQECKLDIKYIYKNNGGKHTALNLGVENAKYDFFFCVDSDDTISNDCVKKIKNICNIIRDKEDVIGIIAYKENLKNKNSVKMINKTYIRLSELYAKHDYKGETALIYKTKKLIENPFPIIQGERFIPETWQYDRLDKIGKCYFLQEVVYYYEYLEDGYTNNYINLIKQNIIGYELFCIQRMNIGIYLKSRLKGAAFYNLCQTIKKTKKTYFFQKHWLMLIITYFPALIYYKKKFK